VSTNQIVSKLELARIVESALSRGEEVIEPITGLRINEVYIVYGADGFGEFFPPLSINGISYSLGE